MCPPGLGGSSNQVLLWAAWASGGLLQPQHGPGHTSTVPCAERGRDGGRDRSYSAATSSSIFQGLKNNTCPRALFVLAPQTVVNYPRSFHPGTLPPTTSKMLKPRQPSSSPSLCRIQCWPGCSSWTRPRTAAKSYNISVLNNSHLMDWNWSNKQTEERFKHLVTNQS